MQELQVVKSFPKKNASWNILDQPLAYILHQARKEGLARFTGNKKSIDNQYYFLTDNYEVIPTLHNK